jgi:catechol 2,3-dioxygenase-like lactoylglutathione lyase family enzyme
MPPPRIRPTQIHHVALHVRDLERSAAFFCRLFGLIIRPAVPPGGNVCVCTAPMDSDRSSFGIVLIQGLSGGTQPVGMDHLSLEVPSAEDVEDVYAIALMHGTVATEPRIYGGFYQTFIFDPDGYKIEVVTRELPAKPDVLSTKRDVARARPEGVVSAPRDAHSRESRAGHPAPGSDD